MRERNNLKTEFEREGWTYTICDDGRLYLRRSDGNGRVYLVGWFTDGVLYKEENENGLHRKNRAFGFPYYLIAYLYKYEGLKEIRVRYKGKEYRLDMDTITENGKLRRDLIRIEEYDYTEKRLYIPVRLFNSLPEKRFLMEQKSLF